MGGLRVAGVTKRYGDVEVLKGIDFEMAEGSIVALLGSSGSGKTTLLRLIAGFSDPDSGTIVIGDKMVAGERARVPPERRNIGYVPQEGALFPHMTVAQNICFGLRGGRRDPVRLGEVMAITGLSGFEERYPHQLSGGQQQRTALARALAPRPSLILLDEPFNALDLDLRRAMASDVAEALRSAGATAILVTHDPHEAFASADYVAAMTAGLIAKFDTPAALYHSPLNANVARLTGAAVFLDAVVEQDRARTCLGSIPVEIPHAPLKGLASVMLRPEQIILAPQGDGADGRVLRVIFNGDHHLATVEVEGLPLPVRVTDGERLHQGALVKVTVAGAGIAFDRGHKAR